MQDRRERVTVKNSVLMRFVRKLVAGPGDSVPARNEQCHACSRALEEVVAGEHTVLRCPSCQGSWLTAECLASALCQKSTDRDLSTLASAEPDADIGHTFAPSRVQRVCPLCAIAMTNDRFEDSGVWIDSCPEGHGIWLDRGELKLLQQRRAHPPSAHQMSDLESSLEDTVSDLLLDFL